MFMIFDSSLGYLGLLQFILGLIKSSSGSGLFPILAPAPNIRLFCLRRLWIPGNYSTIFGLDASIFRYISSLKPLSLRILSYITNLSVNIYLSIWLLLNYILYIWQQCNRVSNRLFQPFRVEHTRSRLLSQGIYSTQVHIFQQRRF